MAVCTHFIVQSLAVIYVFEIHLTKQPVSDWRNVYHSSWCTIRFVKTKCPKWFVPICISKPSLVFMYGQAITPALLIKIFSFEYFERNSFVKFRTESNEDKSKCINRISFDELSAFVFSKACSPFLISRHAITMVAPRLARSITVHNPIPVFAPVTITIFPSRRTLLLHFLK